MALASTSFFASFDVSAGAYTQDISPFLAEAIYYDLNFLEAVNIDWDMPVMDTVHYWNEDALNSDTLTITSTSHTSAATTICLSSTAMANRTFIGALLGVRTIAATEIMQVTDISGVSLTVTRGYNSTTAQSIASGATLFSIDAQQEGSDIGNDASVAPTVRSNQTQILGVRDLKVTGTQLARKMAATELQDWVGHQVANRMIEMRRKLAFAAIYGEPSGTSAGSDTVYRTMQGIRSWARVNGVVYSTSGAFSYSTLNTVNKSLVDLGLFADTLLVGTDLVGSISGIDSTLRRMYESDRHVGYTVQEIQLYQGNTVRVVVDSRVNTGDFFLFDRGRFRLKPMNGRGAFVIAATDFADGRKRRVLGEWTNELRNPEAAAYGYNQT